MNHNFGGDLRGELRLVQLLEAATGLDAVPSASYPETEMSVHVLVEEVIGTKTLQRFALQARSEGLVLCTWPAELKTQAKEFYRADRVARFLDFLAEKDQAWRAEPKAQLAFRSAAARQRVYLRCDLGIEEYVNRWLGDDFAQVGEHSRDEVLPDLWRWLQERGYAAPSDELAAFLTRLGKRPAFLRPGIALERPWSWTDAEELDRRGALANEISDAITDVLTVLREPLPPACAVRRTVKAEVTRKALEDVLIQRARWTHTRLSDGSRKGVELHEETITQDLLLDIAMAMPAMTVETFTKRQEARNGADWQWEWWFEGRQWFGLRVQAKRLKRLNSRRLGYDLGYKSGKQLDLLISDAAHSGLRAAYVLYNGLELDLSAFGSGCGRLPREPESFGVTLLPASVAKELVEQGRDDFATVAGVSRPWSCLAGCHWSECDRWGRYENELSAETGGDLSAWAAMSYRYIEGVRRADPARSGIPELGFRKRPPDYVENLLGRGTTAGLVDNVPEDPRLPARVGAVTIFRTAG
jgi:hypothetical protein